jgi:urate oxidase / 2-oxo-4-hydroxy-4-carboxy-5-ureidoimidazoline decarboxylase
MHATIRYGKGQVTLYRTYAAPLAGLEPIPESPFAGRANTLFAVDVDVEVFGDNFLAAYTEGDNRDVVATDTMKNFILRQALAFEGATLEGLLAFLARQFLQTYPVMHTLRLSGRQVPFAAATVPQESGGFGASGVLFSRSHDDHALATLDVERSGDDVAFTAHRCGQVGLQLIKLTGSSFTSFVRDEFTTLPERVDRPLFIFLDVFWRYADAAQAVGDSPGYVAAEQVRDCVAAVFHRFVSRSIQHLVYEMATALLGRFPQLAEVSFEAQNRLWDTAAVREDDERVKVYCDPRPPYGMIGLTLKRDDL